MYRVALTGCGAIAQVHAAVLRSLPQVRLCACCDIVREKAESADAWGAKSPSKRGFYDWTDVDMDAYSARVNAPYWGFIDWKFPEAECTW